MPNPSLFSNAKDNAPVWPLPILNGNVPTVFDRGLKMLGTHLGYENELPVPRFVPAFACAAGEIIYAGKGEAGYTLIVDHLNGWATYYTGLDHMFAKPRAEIKTNKLERVKSGDVLGYVDLKSGEHALYFELWKREDGHFAPTDAMSHMFTWALLPWTDERVARNIATAPIAA